MKARSSVIESIDRNNEIALTKGEFPTSLQNFKPVTLTSSSIDSEQIKKLYDLIYKICYQ